MLVTPDLFSSTLDKLVKYPDWVVDLETTGLDPFGRDVMCGIVIRGIDSVDDSATADFYFPYRHREDNLPMGSLGDLINTMGHKNLWGWNFGFDLQFLWNDGLTMYPVVRDCMLDHHLLNENERTFQLKSLSVKYLRPDANKEDIALQSLLETNLLGKGDMWRLRPDQVEPYACDDTKLTDEMRRFHKSHIEKQHLDKVAIGVGRYCVTTARCVRRGFRVDPDRIQREIKDARARMFEINSLARTDAGRPINLSSPKQCANWLQVPSTAAEVLKQFALDDGALGKRAKLLQEFRAYHKAIGTYYNKFLEVADPHDIIHPNVFLFGTVSGRQAVRNPPMQSLPTNTDIYRVKHCLIPHDGHVLLRSDFSQAEIRLACDAGNEVNMARIIHSGKNQHQVVSDDLNIPYSAAKRLNFSVIYGIGKDALAEGLGIPVKQAAGYLNKYHRNYPGFRRLYYEMQEIAKKQGFITMWSGRRRHYNQGEGKTPTHKASSNLIQGGVAEIMRCAQINLMDVFDHEDVHQIAQVHDDAIMEVPIDSVDRLAPEIKSIMEIKDRFMLPMTVDIKWGHNMADTIGQI